MHIWFISTPRQLDLFYEKSHFYNKNLTNLIFLVPKCVLAKHNVL